MTKNDLFQVGAKLLGLKALLSVLVALLAVVPILMRLLGFIRDSRETFGAREIPLLISPILLTIAGFYLLRSRTFGQRIISDATEDQLQSQAPEYFTLGVKLYAVYLVISTIPGLLQMLANLLFLANQQFAAQMSSMFGIQYNVLPHLAAIALGIALVFKAEILTSWVFPSPEVEDPEDI